MQPIILPLSELKPALAGLQKVIHAKANPPILRCVKIERTSEGWIALTGTDLERFITVRLEQPTEGPPLTLVVPLDRLSELIKSTPRNESLSLAPSANPSQIHVRFPLTDHQCEATLPAAKVEEFPVTPRLKGDSIPLPAELRNTIHEAMECASSDTSRFVLNGAFIDTSNSKGTYVVATDGRHLYSANSFTLPLKNSILLPTHKFLGWKEFNGDGEWQLKADNDHVQISSRRWRFISRQIQGKYPDWRAVMPKPEAAKTTIEIDPTTLDSLQQVLQRLPCHDEQYQSVGIRWTKDRRLQLLAKQQPTDDWHRVPVSECQGSGPEVTIFVDRRLVVKALRYGLNTFHIHDEMSPLRLSSKGKQMVVMPVRATVPVHPPRPQPKPVQRPVIPTQPHQPPPLNSTPSSQAPQPPAVHVQIPTLEEVMEQTQQLRELLQNGLQHAKELTGKLRFLQREQKSSDREVQTVRSRLRFLQGLKI